MSNFIDTIISKFSKNKEETINKKSSKASLHPCADFIPFACHYNKNTILTKNGELLQTLRINSFKYYNLGKSIGSLRHNIRKIIATHVNRTQFSVYLHTIRQKRNLDSNFDFPSDYATKINKKWVGKNHWDETFVNEVYITIVSSSIPINVNYKNFIGRIFFTESLIKQHNIYLEKSSKDLQNTVDKILNVLCEYGAKRLELIYSEKYGYYSELMKFFSKITPINSSNFEIGNKDLSKTLGELNIQFGTNLFEIKKPNHSIFGMMFSVKNHSSINDEIVNELLQLPIIFTITQSIVFTNIKEDTNQFSYQNGIIEEPGKESILEISGFNQYQEDSQNLNLFINQVTIMLTENSIDELENSLKIIAKYYAQAGLQLVLEDVKSEHCFWSQLPANFKYITRQNVMPISKVGAFSSLYNFPFGTLQSIWGDYITIFKTYIGTPYFFNFHVKNSGHSLVVGYNDALFNFIISQATKLKPRLMYLDSDLKSKTFIEELGGKYFILKINNFTDHLNLNPLLLPETQENKNFLKYWFIFLLNRYSNPENLDDFLKIIESAVDEIYLLPVSERILSNASKFFTKTEFKEINETIIKELKDWGNDGPFKHIFNNDTDDIIAFDNILGLDISELESAPMYVSLPIVSYLLHIFKIGCSKSIPSILAVLKVNTVFNNIYFEKNLKYILRDLEKLNSILFIQASFMSNQVNWSKPVGQVYNESMTTKIFLTNTLIEEKESKDIFEITPLEESKLNNLSSNQFLLRQNKESITCNFSTNKLFTD